MVFRAKQKNLDIFNTVRSLKILLRQQLGDVFITQLGYTSINHLGFWKNADFVSDHQLSLLGCLSWNALQNSVKRLQKGLGRIHSGNSQLSHHQVIFLTFENGGQSFCEMSFLNTTVRTRNYLRIVREKAESLVRMNHQLMAIVALKNEKKSLA